MSEKQSNEQRYYDCLKRIAKYMTPEQLYRDAKNIGLEPGEYIEMVYENIQQEARNAVYNKRRPKA